MTTATNSKSTLTRYAWLSIAAALLTIALKTAAYLITGSVGLLSDALESLVNLAAAVMALIALTVAARPPDELHAYGHTKAEYFSSGAEGALILLAAASIIWTAVPRLISPQPLEQVGIGLAIALVASGVNFIVSRIILRAGREHRSIALEADAHHLMTDVWTSVGVLVAVGAVALTGWDRLDPTIALIVAANIIRTGVQLLRRSTMGLLDTALDADEQAVVDQILDKYRQEGIHFHALRSRQSGTVEFLSVHVLVPGDWTVLHGHHLVEQIETELEQAIPGLSVITHLEALEDPAAWTDSGPVLDTPPPSQSA